MKSDRLRILHGLPLRHDSRNTANMCLSVQISNHTNVAKKNILDRILQACLSCVPHEMHLSACITTALSAGSSKESTISSLLQCMHAAVLGLPRTHDLTVRASTPLYTSNLTSQSFSNAP